MLIFVAIEPNHMLLRLEDLRYLVMVIFTTVTQQKNNISICTSSICFGLHTWLCCGLRLYLMLLLLFSPASWWRVYLNPSWAFLTTYYSTGKNESKWGSLTVFKMPNICLAAKASFYPEGHLAWQTFSHLWIGDLLIYLFIYLVGVPLPVLMQNFFNSLNYTNSHCFLF